MGCLKRVAQYAIILLSVVVAREVMPSYFLGGGSLFWVLVWSAGTGLLVGAISGLTGAWSNEGFLYGFLFWVLLWGVSAALVVAFIVVGSSSLWTGLLWGCVAGLDGIIGVHFGNAFGEWARARFLRQEPEA